MRSTILWKLLTSEEEHGQSATWLCGLGRWGRLVIYGILLILVVMTVYDSTKLILQYIEEPTKTKLTMYNTSVSLPRVTLCFPTRNYNQDYKTDNDNILRQLWQWNEIGVEFNIVGIHGPLQLINRSLSSFKTKLDFLNGEWNANVMNFFYTYLYHLLYMENDGSYCTHGTSTPRIMYRWVMQSHRVFNASLWLANNQIKRLNITNGELITAFGKKLQHLVHLQRYKTQDKDESHTALWHYFMD